MKIMKQKAKRPYAMRKPRGLHPNGLPQRMLSLILAGEEKTREGWAKHFKIKELQLDSVLSSIRKHGYPVFPIGGVYGKQKGRKAGILKLVTEKEEWSQEAQARYKHGHIMPRLKTAFMVYEKVVEAFPELLGQVENDIGAILIMVLSKKKELAMPKYDADSQGSNT
jgi:hypothetical protein